MRTCLDCGEPIKGRSDKKFCADQCRNNFNNRLNRNEMNFIRNVQNILRRNRRILDELNREEPTRVHRDELIARGFNFTFHTHTFTAKDEVTYFFCFDQGYRDLGNEYFSLVLGDDRLDQETEK
jgi:predicted nucleic acid-binding Zn ribbon protein